jgi:hypothetical protein
MQYRECSLHSEEVKYQLISKISVCGQSFGVAAGALCACGSIIPEALRNVSVFGRGIVEEDFGGKTAACGDGVFDSVRRFASRCSPGLDQLGSMGPSAKGYAGGRKGFGIFFRNCNGGGAAGSRWLRGIQSVQKCDFQYGIGELENEP